METTMKIRVQVDATVKLDAAVDGVPPELTKEHFLDRVLGAFNVVDGGGELLRPAHVQVDVVAEPLERTDFFRPVESARAIKANDQPHERAIRVYKASPGTWELQVRAPIGIGGGYRDGKDFIVAGASCKRDDLVALRDAIGRLLDEEASRAR